MQLLACCKALVEVSGKDCQPIAAELFKVGLTVAALSNSEELQSASEVGMLNDLAQVLGLSREDLFKQHLGSMLKNMKNECHEWTATSHRVAVFSRTLMASGGIVGFYPDLVVSIFHSVLGPRIEGQEIEPELKLKMFMVLSRQLYNVKNTLDSQDQFKHLALKITTGNNHS